MSDWPERQLIRAVVMATNGATAKEIGDAIGKDAWMVRNRLAYHGVPLLGAPTDRRCLVPVMLPFGAHFEIKFEAGRRGFSVEGLVGRMAEIIAGDRLFDAVLGNHQQGAI